MIGLRTIAAAVAARLRTPRASRTPPTQPDDLAILRAKEKELERVGAGPDAIPLAIEILALREKLLDPHHGDISRGYSLVAKLLMEHGRAAEAEPYLRRDLAFMEKECGPRSEQVAHCLMQLAALLRELGRVAEAEPLEQRGGPLLQKAEAEKPWSAAWICLRYGAYKDAERHAKEALAALEKLFGPDHPDVAKALCVVAYAVKPQGRLTETEALYRRALAILEKTYGPEHDDVVSCLSSLADVLQEDRRLDEAEKLFRQCMTIQERKTGIDKPAAAASNLAECLRLMNRLDEAELLYRRALAFEEKLFGTDNVEVALLQYGLAFVLDAQGRPEEAKPLYDAAYWPLLQKLEFEDPIHERTSRNHGDLLVKQGHYTDAEGHYESSLKVAEKVFGQESPNVGINLYKLANVRHWLRRNTEAELMARRALEILEKTRGPAHPDTAEAREVLVKVLRALGRDDEAEKYVAGPDKR